MRRTLAATLLVMTVALSGCSGGDGGSTSGPAAGNGGSEKAAGTEAKPAAPNARDGKAPQATTGTGEKEQPSIARSIVRTGSLTVQVKDVDGDDDVLDARQQLSTIVSGLRGVIANEVTGNDHDGAISRAELTVRIPTAAYDGAVRRLSTELGTVKLLKQDSQDVTEQVVDVNSRIATQRAGLARMRALLGRARTVGEIITVESELTRREADLESLLARQKQLADQTELATLTVVLLKPGKPEPPPPPPADRGFLHGLGKGWDAFSGTVSALAMAVGALLPFAVTLAVIGVPGWLLYRRRRTPAAGDQVV
jgi:hypothetical protein